jgi:hypothetical protein
VWIKTQEIQTVAGGIKNSPGIFEEARLREVAQVSAAEKQKRMSENLTVVGSGSDMIKFTSKKHKTASQDYLHDFYVAHGLQLTGDGTYADKASAKGASSEGPAGDTAAAPRTADVRLEAGRASGGTIPTGKTCIPYNTRHGMAFSVD